MECYYKLRVDLCDTSLEKVISCIRDSNAYAYVREGQDENPHVHFYIATTVSNPTLRARIRSLGLSGNKSYSLKRLEERYPLQYLAYLHKEGRVISKNIPLDILTQAVKLSESYKKEKKERKSKKVWKDIMSLLPDTPSYQDIAEAVIKYHLEKEILIRKFQLQAMADTIFLHKFPQYATGCLISELTRNNPFQN